MHVHTQVDEVTLGYARFMWETMLNLARNPDRLKLTIHCMSDPTPVRTAAASWRSVNDVRHPGSGRGSTGHGICVNDALSMTGDGDIHVIADSDTVVLARGWDTCVERVLEYNSCFGVRYEDPGGFSSGNSHIQTYKWCPNFVWIALSGKHDWRDLDALPRKDQNVKITTLSLGSIYNLPVGYEVLCDVGWKLPEYLYLNKLWYTGLEQLKPTGPRATVLKGLSDYHEEYHVDGVPFVAHHRGSMRHAYRQSEISKLFYAAVDAHLARESTIDPRW